MQAGWMLVLVLVLLLRGYHGARVGVGGSVEMDIIINTDESWDERLPGAFGTGLRDGRDEGRGPGQASQVGKLATRRDWGCRRHHRSEAGPQFVSVSVVSRLMVLKARGGTVDEEIPTIAGGVIPDR